MKFLEDPDKRQKIATVGIYLLWLTIAAFAIWVYFNVQWLKVDPCAVCEETTKKICFDLNYL